MKVDFLVQNEKDKVRYLAEFMQKQGIMKEELAYLGDDLNDLGGMQLAGFVGCPADACEEIKGVSDYVSSVKGGYGAVRDIITYLLKERDEWKDAVRAAYGFGI